MSTPESISDHGPELPRVRFGAGLRHKLRGEVERLGAQRTLILTTPRQSGLAEELARTLGDLYAGTCTKAKLHTPVAVTEDGLKDLNQMDADCLVSLGGGSVIGLGKALSYRTGLPHITLPTTYSGSEATPILGQTENGIKTTLSDDRIRPQVLLYDTELFVSLPTAIAVTSGLNAMAHAVEALYAANRTDSSTALAIRGIEAFADGLPKLVRDPQDLEARSMTLQGAWACGTVLGQVGMALHHKLCHTLGGTLNLPHADTHAIILPHAAAYNERAARAELEPVAGILGATSAGAALYGFAKGIGAPLALRDLGLQKPELDRIIELATKNPYPNPRPVTAEGLAELLNAAWAGKPPVS